MFLTFFSYFLLLLSNFSFFFLSRNYYLINLRLHSKCFSLAGGREPPYMNPLCSLQHLLQLVGLAAQRRSHPGHRYTCWAAGSGCSAWCLGWIWAQQPCGLLAACTYMSHSYSNLLPLSARALVASDHMVNVHKWWFHINEPHCVNITFHMQPELSHNVF